MDTYQPSLDGIDPKPASGPGKVGDLGAAAIRTVEALEAEGLLRPRHALLVQMIRTLAQSIDKNLERDGKVTVAISQATKQLLDALAALPEPAVKPAQGFEEMFGEWQAARQEAMR